MLTDADPAIVVLPDGTIRLITPQLTAPTEDLPPPPPPADYQPCSTDGGKRARGRSDGLRLSPPPTTHAGTRYARSSSEDERAHSDWAQAYPRCASLQSPRTLGILTAADVLREFPRHYLALSPAAPPPGSLPNRGVSADISRDEHIPLPAWRPLVPGGTYQVVPHTLRQAGEGVSSRSLLRTFASCPERFDSATHRDAISRGIVSVAENKPVSRRSALSNGTPAPEGCPTSCDDYGDVRSQSPGCTHPPTCTRYKLHHDNPPRSNWSQGDTISRSVSYSGPHATGETPRSYTTCDSPSGLQERGTPVVPAAVGVNNGVGSRATGDSPAPLLLAPSSLTFPPSTSTGSSSKRLLRKVKLSALCKWFYGSSCSGNDGSADCCEVRENNVLEWDEGSNVLNFASESAINGYSCSCCFNVIRTSNTASSISRSSTTSSINTNTPRSTSVSSATPRGHLGNDARHKRNIEMHAQPGCCSRIMRSLSLVTEEPFSRIELCSTEDACMEDMRRAAMMLELALKRTEDYEV